MSNIIDADLIKKNCLNYAKSSPKAIEVLKNADGKRDYLEISKLVKIHPTKASSLLKKSEKYGLTKKNKDGLYHRVPGVLGFMPRLKNKKIATSKEEMKDIENKVKCAIKKHKKAVYPKHSFFPSSISEMAEAYTWLYITENALRNLIRSVLGQTSSWWKVSSPPGVRSAVQNEIQRAPYDGVKRNDELEFTHLGQLKDIILFGSNWNTFKSIINEKDKEKFRITIEKAIPTRNSIGHCILLKGIYLKEAQVRFNDIIKMII